MLGLVSGFQLLHCLRCLLILNIASLNREGGQCRLSNQPLRRCHNHGPNPLPRNHRKNCPEAWSPNGVRNYRTVHTSHSLGTVDLAQTYRTYSMIYDPCLLDFHITSLNAVIPLSNSLLYRQFFFFVFHTYPYSISIYSIPAELQTSSTEVS